jgi:hypothetical protein
MRRRPASPLLLPRTFPVPAAVTARARPSLYEPGISPGQGR